MIAYHTIIQRMSFLPGCIFQSSRKRRIIIGWVFKGVIPCSCIFNELIGVFSSKRILQSLIKCCFAIGSSLTFFKFLGTKHMEFANKINIFLWKNAGSDLPLLEWVLCTMTSDLGEEIGDIPTFAFPRLSWDSRIGVLKAYYKTDSLSR